MIMEGRETNEVMKFKRETQRAEGLAGPEAQRQRVEVVLIWVMSH